MTVRIDGETWMNWCTNMAAVPKDKTLVWLKLPDGTVRRLSHEKQPQFPSPHREGFFYLTPEGNPARTKENLMSKSKTKCSGSSHCYLAVSRDGKTHSTDSANDMSIFMWGRSASEWTLYKRCSFHGGDVAELRDKLEAR